MDLAAVALGSTIGATLDGVTTFDLRARHGGEAWEPAIVLCGDQDVPDELARDVVEICAHPRRGLGVVVGQALPGALWTLRCAGRQWVLDPLGIELVPVGVTAAEIEVVDELIRWAGSPLDEDDIAAAPSTAIDDAALCPAQDTAPYSEPPWSVMVRLLGELDVLARDGSCGDFERSKAVELIAWLATHRESPTRARARAALWDHLDVRDATFANVVSEARRALARLVAPPHGAEWIGRTLTEALPLHPEVVTDVELLAHRLAHARHRRDADAMAVLRAGVELVRGTPFSGTSFLWADAEGLASNAIVQATAACTELACMCLHVGDLEGVFWATGRGLAVLPGHEELIALRMRAHAGRGDLAGVRAEWDAYERVLAADMWRGEPAAKLVQLRAELLATSLVAPA